MKTYAIQLTHKSLAKLFLVNKKTVISYINRESFIPDNIVSICDFYGRNKKKIDERYKKWQGLYTDYKNLQSFGGNRSYVEKMLREWGEEDKIRKSKLF